MGDEAACCMVRGGLGIMAGWVLISRCEATTDTSYIGFIFNGGSSVFSGDWRLQF